MKSNHPPQNFPGPVAGIILGAGRSTRMGRTKQLLPWQGSTILGQVLDQARRSCLAPLIVVLGHDAERITQKVDLAGAKVVVNPDFARGQGTSLRAGLEGLPQGAEAALFLLGDQPLVTASVIDRILREYRSQKTGIIIPLYQGQHIIADEGLREPRTYRDVFKILTENGVLKSEFLPVFEKIAAFRNVLVHQYEKVDDAIVYGVFKKNLLDIEEFLAQVITWYQEKESQN